jgi:hypothetical protein
MKASTQLSKHWSGESVSRKTLFMYILIIVVLTGALRYRLLDVPLERDEGGFAYMAQQLLDGTPPYTQAYDYKPPGLYIMYAVFITLFGGSPAGIHIGLLVMSVGTMIMLFLLVKSWSNATGAGVTAILSTVLLTSPSVLGFAAHATQFVMFWVVLGHLLLEYSMSRNQRLAALAAGAAFGCAVLMKQSGVLFFLSALVLLFATRKEEKRAASEFFPMMGFLTAGFIIPISGVLVWLWAANARNGFWYWNVEYPSIVAQNSGMNDLIPRISRNALQAAGNFILVWILGLISIVYIAIRRRRIKAFSRIMIFFIFSLAAVCIGYETRSHYFVLVMPAIAAATGIAVSEIADNIKQGFRRKLVISIPYAITLLGVVAQSGYFFTADPESISRSIYYPNLFADVNKVSEFIRSRTTDSDRVAILGSEPEILFLSGRRSATRYIFTNFFHEKHNLGERMENEMIREIDSVKPAMIVMINQPFSWGAMPSGSWPILRWARKYLQQNYDLVGTVTQTSQQSSSFRWDQEARDNPAALASSIIIFRRVAGNAPGS